MKLVLGCLIFSLTIACPHVSSAAFEITGTVKTTSGKPLAEAFIICRSLNYIAETGRDGTFSIPRQSQSGVIFFRRAGFRPLTKIINSSTTKLEIVLEEAAATERLLPPCSGLRDRLKRVGYNLRLPVPKGTIVHQGNDVDYSYFSIGYGTNNDRVWLSGIHGPMATLGVPPDDWILNAQEFTERSYRCGQVEGVDMRGRLLDGTYWRYVGNYGESVEYSVASEEAATFFDKIIDNACIGKSLLK